jgi:hypothetical protein
MLIKYPGVDTEFTFGMFVFGIVGFFAFLYISGKSHFQWVVIDQHYLTARCLWKILLKKEWTDIHEVKIVRYPISVLFGFYARWFVFDDGSPDTKNHNYILDEKRPIMVKYNQRSLKVVKQFWNGPIIGEDAPVSQK